MLGKDSHIIRLERSKHALRLPGTAQRPPRSISHVSRVRRQHTGPAAALLPLCGPQASAPSPLASGFLPATVWVEVHVEARQLLVIKRCLQGPAGSLREDPIQ